eukprot:6189753-Pleurochrysis_carterae.AAC.3
MLLWQMLLSPRRCLPKQQRTTRETSLVNRSGEHCKLPPIGPQMIEASSSPRRRLTHAPTPPGV